MARRALTLTLAVVGLGVVVPLLVAHRHDIAAALALLVTVCPAWLSVAALAEAVSYLTRGGATRAVLRGAAPTVGTAALTAITVVADAVAYVLPFGFAAGGAVAVGQAHRRGASRAAAVRAFAVVTLVGVAVLVALGLAAAGVAALASGPGAVPSGPGLLAIGATVAVIAVAVAVRRVAARRRTRRAGAARSSAVPAGLQPVGIAARLHLGPRSAAGLRAMGMAARPPVGPGEAAARHAMGMVARPPIGPGVGTRLWARWDELRRRPLPARSVGAAAAGMLLSWLADLSVLALAFVALGERPPWAGLVLAYCLGQAVSALPFTPGGLAVVEGGLTATLVAFGGCPAGTLTAVLLYRLISHWAIVPAGGLIWLALRRRAADEFPGERRSAFAEGDERCPTRT